jgi:cytochrome c oxidase assembly protein subunit 15
VDKKYLLFRKFALLSTIATYLLIFIGGLVRVSGSGLGCPDWPKCFGSWIPPLSKSQIPAGFDISSFNLTLAWIEYINRIAGMVTGVLILITAILAIKYFRNKRPIMVSSVLAAIFVAFQGWYGSIVVKSQLMPLTVSIHMLLALVIVSLLIYTTVHSYFIDIPMSGPGVKKHRFMLLFLWVFMIIQILLGTEFRSQVELVWEKFPLLSGAEVLKHIGIVAISHTFLGVILLGSVILITLSLIRLNSVYALIKQGMLLMILLTIIQVIIGIAMHIFGISPLFQVFHLWMASIIIGLILLVYTGLSYKKVNS